VIVRNKFFGPRPRGRRAPGAIGFSLIEVLVSVAIITILMAAVFQFLHYAQQRYRGDQLLAERNQSARTALEVLTQELQQAGNNPNFTPSKTIAGALDIQPLGGIVNIPVNNTAGIYYGNLVEIGSGTGLSPCAPNREVLEVRGDSTHTITATSFPAIITLCHSVGQPVSSRSLPFPTGILYTATTSGTGQNAAVNTLQFYGDIQGDGTLSYGEYNLSGPVGTSKLLCMTSSGTQPCNIYRLTRYLTPILNPDIPASKAESGTAPSPLADNLLGFPDSTGAIRNPDQKPVFQLNFDTYGNLSYGATTYVRSIDVGFTLQTTDIDPELNQYRTIQMKSNIAPTNINYAWGVTILGGSTELPFVPTDPAGHTLPIP
jgi:prepilin-type N-terminal cleavage/methylation domain-containing protein